MSAENPGNRGTGIKRYLSVIVFTIFCVWIVIFIRGHRSEFSALRAISIGDLGLIFSLAFLGITLRGLYTSILTSPYGVRLRRLELFFISLVSTIGNYTLPMRGGVGLRALYLKKKHRIGYKQFARISVARFSTIFLVDSLLGLIAVLVLWKTKGFLDLPVTLVLLIGLAASFSVHLSSRVSIGNRSRLVERLVGGPASELRLSDVRWRMILATLLNSTVRFFWIFTCFHAISIDLTMIQGLLISSLIPLSMVVTLTPGNLGVTEGLLIYVTGVMGIGASSAIICSILMRSSTIFWSVTMIPFLRRSFREIRGDR